MIDVDVEEAVDDSIVGDSNMDGDVDDDENMKDDENVDEKDDVVVESTSEGNDENVNDGEGSENNEVSKVNGLVDDTSLLLLVLANAIV
jgi:hypothetical protein